MATDGIISVFLVEDNELYSLMLDNKMQEVANYRFTTFSTAEEALKNLYLKPDIIIMDYFLPGIDGLQATREIKQRRPDIPVVFLSVTDEAGIREDALHAGASVFMRKGKESIESLYLVINDLLTEKEKHSGSLL